MSINAGIDPLDGAAVQARQLESAQFYADSRNKSNQFIFDAEIVSYNQNMAIGQPGVKTVPVAPAKWIVVTPTSGYPYADVSPTEVLTSAIPITTFDASKPVAPLPDNVIDVGTRMSGPWFHQGPQNTYRDDSKARPATSADGVTGLFLFFPGIGTTGWFELQPAV